VSDSDPLVVEDWSAYEKSMLDVLREERRTRPKPAPVERPMSPEALRQVVQGKAVEPVPVESSIGVAAPQAVVLALSREQPGQVPPSTADEHEASSAEATPQSALVPPFEQQCEPAPKPAVMELVQDHVSPAAASVSSTQPAHREASWWRIPLFLSSLAVAVAGGTVALVKPDRQVNPVTKAVIAQEQLVQKNSSAPVSAVDESTKDQPKDEYEVSRERVSLRGAPADNASVVRTLRQGTAVTIKERSAENEWCRVEAARSREGWMKCAFLKTGPTRQD
jgi:hypothetical protein